MSCRDARKLRWSGSPPFPPWSKSNVPTCHRASLCNCPRLSSTRDGCPSEHCCRGLPSGPTRKGRSSPSPPASGHGAESSRLTCAASPPSAIGCIHRACTRSGAVSPPSAACARHFGGWKQQGTSRTTGSIERSSYALTRRVLTRLPAALRRSCVRASSRPTTKRLSSSTPIS